MKAEIDKIIEKHKDLLDYIKDVKEEAGGRLLGFTVRRTAGLDGHLILIHVEGDNIPVLFYNRDKTVEVVNAEGDSKTFGVKEEEQNVLLVFIIGELLKEYTLTWVGE